jgi:hypothetical protein
MLGDSADAINVIQRPGRTSSLAASFELLAADLEPVLHIANRGRSRVELAAEIAMAERTFRLFKAQDGRSASVNGATQIRAGVMRPEILVPLQDARSSSSNGSQGEVGVLVVAGPGRGEEGDQEAEGNADEEEQALWAHSGSVPMSPAAPGAAFPPK